MCGSNCTLSLCYAFKALSRPSYTANGVCHAPIFALLQIKAWLVVLTEVAWVFVYFSMFSIFCTHTLNVNVAQYFGVCCFRNPCHFPTPPELSLKSRWLKFNGCVWKELSFCCLKNYYQHLDTGRETHCVGTSLIRDGSSRKASVKGWSADADQRHSETLLAFPFASLCCLNWSKGSSPGWEWLTLLTWSNKSLTTLAESKNSNVCKILCW